MIRDTIIWDLDGTLSDGTHRLHLLPKTDPHLARSWDEFNGQAINDGSFINNIELLRSQYEAGFHIIILTGRNEVVRGDTEKWLARNNVPYHELKMRGYDDNRKDTSLKEEFLTDYGLGSILCCFDDLWHLVVHLRGLGLTVHQVTHYGGERVDLQSHGSDE